MSYQSYTGSQLHTHHFAVTLQGSWLNHCRNTTANSFYEDFLCAYI